MKPRLLIVQPNLQPPGGGQAVAAWAVDALQHDYQLDLFTWIPFDAAPVNRFYGTAIQPTKLRTKTVPAWLRRLIALDPDSYSFLRVALMMRQLKRKTHQYDLILSFCDEVDFGTRSLQFINYPYLGEVYRRDCSLAASNRIAALAHRLQPWRVLAGFSFERVRQNFTLANSAWGASEFRRYYDVEAKVLYPPVPWSAARVPWQQRELGFACIGRIDATKRYEDMIAVLNQVRANGHVVTFHIIGAADARHVDPAYFDMLRALVRVNAAWVTLHDNFSRIELEQLVSHLRYGIHGKRDEHFGIAPAELVRAGCIVFVPDDGGQVEIVGDCKVLRYRSLQDAAAKITRVLANEQMQEALRTHLAARAGLFTPERFAQQLRAHVAAVLAAPQKPSC